MRSTQEILVSAKEASRALMTLGTEIKNEILLKMADALESESQKILEANRLDVKRARETLGEVMIDRLLLDERRIHGMADGIRRLAELPDPVGEILEENTLENGLSVRRVRVPIGVIGIIYESRPNVTSDAGTLCFKSGNVCVLRGGREAYATSLAIVNVLRDVLSACGQNPNFINIAEDYTRQSAVDLMNAVGYVDALIPRGGAGLIRACVENAKVPCIQTGTGICHVYVDRSADLSMALNILDNAKTSRPSVCNAAEVCLVHRAVMGEFLPMLRERLVNERARAGLRPVTLKVDARAYDCIGGTHAIDADYDTEFLDYVLAVKVVEDVEEAITHIAAHSTGHSDCIVASDAAATEVFINGVDSAAVYVNASTRFTDGGEFGKGCEIGISTQKLHARGPMGLEELCSYKYIVRGNGQIRA